MTHLPVPALWKEILTLLRNDEKEHTSAKKSEILLTQIPHIMFIAQIGVRANLGQKQAISDWYGHVND